MAQVKQVGLLAAGCQPWNKDVCAASGDRFAYCATLAIYIYQVRIFMFLSISLQPCSLFPKEMLLQEVNTFFFQSNCT